MLMLIIGRKNGKITHVVDCVKGEEYTPTTVYAWNNGSKRRIGQPVFVRKTKHRITKQDVFVPRALVNLVTPEERPDLVEKLRPIVHERRRKARLLAERGKPQDTRSGQLSLPRP